MNAAVTSVGLELKKSGYSFIEFIPPRFLIANVMSGWNNFLLLSQEERNRWTVGSKEDPDDGYICRNGGDHDHKDFFHFKPHLFALLEHKEVKFDDRLEWLLQLNELWHYCEGQLLNEALYDLDEEVGGFNILKRFCSPLAVCHHVLRLLSYNNELKPGQELGKGHTDRNFATIQVHESHPALVLEFPDSTVPYVPEKDRALVFTSQKAEKCTRGILRAVKHRVVFPAEQAEQQGAKRQSIVFFSHIYPDE